MGFPNKSNNSADFGFRTIPLKVAEYVIFYEDCWKNPQVVGKLIRVVRKLQFPNKSIGVDRKLQFPIKFLLKTYFCRALARKNARLEREPMGFPNKSIDFPAVVDYLVNGPEQ